MTLRLLGSLRTSTGVLCALTLAALACSSPTPVPDGSGGAETGSGGSGGVASGGSSAQSGGSASGGGGNATGGTASGGAGGSDPEENASVGRIQVYRGLALDDTSPGRVTATFDYVEQAAWTAFEAVGEACSREQFGDCWIRTCTPTGAQPDQSEQPSSLRLEAGTIMLVPDRDDFTASGMPVGEDNDYTFTTSGTLLGEEIMTVTASGGAIGPFQGMVQVPLAPFLLSHEASSPEAGTVVSIPAPRTADLLISWDARDTAQKMQTVVINPSDASQVTLACTFDATLGSGTILATALSQLPAGTEIHLFAVNSQVVTTPQGDVELLGVMEMNSPDRTGYPMFVLE